MKSDINSTKHKKTPMINNYFGLELREQVFIRLMEKHLRNLKTKLFSGKI